MSVGFSVAVANHAGRGNTSNALSARPRLLYVSSLYIAAFAH